jgi:transposase-like protein
MAKHCENFFAKLVKQNDVAQIAACSETLEADIHEFFSDSAGGDRYSETILEYLASKLSSDSILYTDSKGDKHRIPISFEQHKALYDGFEPLRHPHHIAYAAGRHVSGAPFHEAYSSSREKAIEMYVARLVSADIPLPEEVARMQTDELALIHDNDLIRIFHAHKKRFNRYQGFDYDDSKRSDTYHALKLSLRTYINYHSWSYNYGHRLYLEDTFNRKTLPTILSNPQLDSFTMPDTHLCIKHIESARNLKICIERSRELLNASRPVLTENDGTISYVEDSMVSLDGLNIIAKAHEDVLIARATARKIDHFCHALSANFSEVQKRVDPIELAKNISHFFCANFGRFVPKDNVNLNIPITLIGMELNGVALLTAKLTSVQNRVKESALPEYRRSIIQLVSGLPLNALARFISHCQQDVTDKAIYILNNTWLYQGEYLNLSEEFGTSMIAGFFSDLAKNSPEILKETDLFGTFKKQLYSRNEVYREDEIIAKIDRKFAEIHYAIDETLPENTTQADMSFTKGLTV